MSEVGELEAMAAREDLTQEDVSPCDAWEVSVLEISYLVYTGSFCMLTIWVQMLLKKALTVITA